MPVRRNFIHLLSLCSPRHDDGTNDPPVEPLPTRTIPVSQIAPVPVQVREQSHSHFHSGQNHLHHDHPHTSPQPPANEGAIPSFNPPPFSDFNFEDSEVPSEPPPSYARFDPHPPGCSCPIHIKKSSQPTVIELFQSQGCSTCPATNANLHSVLRHSYDPNVLLLDYHVTYWDHLGWKDGFGNTASNERQWEYARRMGKDKVYTPQVIVNGVVEGVGTTDTGLKDIIQKGQDARKKEKWVNLRLVDDGIVKVSGPQDRKGRVLVVTYSTRLLEADIRAGENLGKRLQYVNVVKNIKSAGDWNGGSERFNVECTPGGERTVNVVMVQEGKGGPIIGILKI